MLDEAELSLKKAVDIAVEMESTENEINHFPNIMIKKLTRLSPKSFSDVANKIIDQISASTKIQNAIFVRKRDSSQKCPEKGKGATSKSAFFFLW